MSFPISPANNQTALVNGVSYVYNQTKGAWIRLKSTTQANVVSNTVTVLNSILFSDGTTQSSAASPTDDYARTTANTATNNITILQGVDATQNTNISVIQGVDTAQNTRMSIIEGVDVTQNTNITSVNQYAASGYAAANTNATNITAVNNYAASAYGSANTNATNITLVNQYAASAYALANTNATNITAVNQYAAAAYAKSNTDLANTGTLVTSNNLTQYVFANTKTSTSNSTGSIVVQGGIGVQGNVYATNEYLLGDIYVGTADGVPLGGATNPIIGAVGNTDYYIQTYQINYANTANASSDFVVYPNNGTDANGWVDLGITSNAYACTAYSITGRNEGYIFMSAPAGSGTSGNLIIATDSTGAYNSIEFYTGGFGGVKGQSNVSITKQTTSTSNTTGTLRVSGGVGVTGNVYVGGTSSGVTGIYTDNLRYAANGLPWVMGSGSSGGTTSFAITLDTFTGNGAQTAFGLSAVPSSKNETMVHINGVYQNKNTYSVSGSTLTLTGVATSSDTIEVETTSGSLMNVAATYYSTRIYTGTGSQTAFTISSGQSANTLFVFNNGICQFPGDDYTVSGTTLTYVVAPAADEVVQIREMPVGRVIPTTVPNMRRYAATGSQTTFTVSSGQTANSMFVYENGVCQVPGNDYTVSGTTLTFLTAPTSDKVIQIREMPV